ncbi:hypothetical protein [Halorientalis marina]|jgi:hypothetical protein|uniref:hypothetical protein n=1 Tax=Halorientalis marina TaxID=2931976 RepID=UPI001FF10D7B|nr:hypothetical protein [Halorientalis marina]
MYTGKTEKPCCLCGNPDTVSRIDIPPRAVQLLDKSGPIAWQDIVGEVSIYFCESDWETVTDLVLDAGMSPLSRCNAARADFDLREDFEALLNDVRDEPDQQPLETEMREESEQVIAEYESDDHIEVRDLVEARVVTWALDDLAAEA